MNEARDSFGGKAAGGGIDPSRERERLAHREFAARIFRGASGVAVEIGRICDHVVELLLPQREWQGGKIGLNHFEGEAIRGGVFSGKRGIGRLKLDPCDRDAGNSSGKAERRRANATAKFKHGFSGTCGHGGRQKHRIDAGAIALRRLSDGHAPPEVGVFGHPGHRPRGISLSRMTFSASSTSPSRTMRRRGIMPMEPSRTLIFTSISKQAIPSPLRRAVAKAMIVGSLLRRSSFMIGDVKAGRDGCRGL